MIVRVAPRDHYPWIASRARLSIGADFQAIEAMREDGTIVGMVGFDGPTPVAVCMHVALDHPAAARFLLRPAFHAAFIDLAREIVYGQVLSTNTRSLAFVKHLGFREVARLRDAWGPGIDKIWLEMRRTDCRWTDHRRAA